LPLPIVASRHRDLIVAWFCKEVGPFVALGLAGVLLLELYQRLLVGLTHTAERTVCKGTLPFVWVQQLAA